MTFKLDEMRLTESAQQKVLKQLPELLTNFKKLRVSKIKDYSECQSRFDSQNIFKYIMESKGDQFDFQSIGHLNLKQLQLLQFDEDADSLADQIEAVILSTMALECDKHYHITDDEGRKKQKFAIKRPFATFLTSATFDILIGAIKQIIERANGSSNSYYQVSLRSILRILLAHLRVADTNQCKLDKLLRLDQLH